MEFFLCVSLFGTVLIWALKTAGYQLAIFDPLKYDIISSAHAPDVVAVVGNLVLAIESVVRQSNYSDIVKKKELPPPLIGLEDRTFSAIDILSNRRDLKRKIADCLLK